MGINGLLQGLKFCCRPGNVQDFANQCVAVDASSWLHRSVYSLADHYVEAIEQGLVDQRSIDASSSYMIKRCEELLLCANVQRIFLVMDGERCPLKAVTNEEREKRRQENLKEARRYKKLGDREKMFEKYKMCIKVKRDLLEKVAVAIAERFQGRQVQIVWSPYEADAQLVKLCIDGLAHAVITEDSDILAYSAACQVAFPVIFKLDRTSGNCDVISLDWLITPDERDLNAALSASNQSQKKSNGLEAIVLAFAVRQLRHPGLGSRLFVQSCVLSGCDYAPNRLEGVGLVTAFKQVRNAIHRSSEDRFRHALNLFPTKARKGVDKIEYEELLAKSEAVFYYHPVIQKDGEVVFLQDPHNSEKLAHAPSLERFGGDWTFLGSRSIDESRTTRAATKPAEGIAAPFREVFLNNHKSLSNHKDRKINKNQKEASTTAVPIINPYAKTRKRARESDDQKPMGLPNCIQKPLDNPVGRSQLIDKENKKNSVSQYFGVDDFRFVKRSFTKTGAAAKPGSSSTNVSAATPKYDLNPVSPN